MCCCILQATITRSQGQLEKLFAKVCDMMQDYAESKTSDGEKTFVRFQSSDGRPVTISSISIDGQTQSNLRNAVSIWNENDAILHATLV